MSTSSDGNRTSILFESREDLPAVTNRGKEIRVPSWLISLIQVTVPAIAVAIGMYYRVTWTEEKVEKLEALVIEKAKDLDFTKARTVHIENKYEILKLSMEKDTERIIDRIDRLDISVKEGRKEMQAQMAIVAQDVKDLQLQPKNGERP